MSVAFRFDILVGKVIIGRKSISANVSVESNNLNSMCCTFGDMVSVIVGTGLESETPITAQLFEDNDSISLFQDIASKMIYV